MVPLLFAIPVVSCGGSGQSVTPPPPPPPTPTLQSIAIQAPGLAFLTGDKVQLTASAAYSNGSTTDVTSTATWTLTPAAFGAITAGGLLTVTTPGSISVKAVYKSVNASQAFTVTTPIARAGDNGFTWESVNTQGMGYVTGLIIHPLAPYDIYIRTDVGGAYRFDRSAQHWIPLLDRFSPDKSESYSVESIAVDPGDVNTVYIAAAHGRILSGSDVSSPAEVFVSHDKGTTWAATGLAGANLNIGGNDSFRGTTGERLAVDPADPSVIYFASRKDGLWRGTAAPASALIWQQVTGLPAPSSSPGISFVIFDPTSGETATGQTKTLYAGVYGSGVYASTDAGASWSAIASTSNPGRAAVAADGTLIVSFGEDEGGTTGSVGRYKAGVWADITPNNDTLSYSGVTTDPANPAIVMAAENNNQRIYRSADQGATWTRISLNSTLNGKPQYYSAGNPSCCDAALVIDPANSKRGWQTNGYGVTETDDITAATTNWAWQMDNLEELVVNKVKVPPVVTVPGTSIPGADLFSVVADMVGFRYASRDMVPTATIDQFPYVAQGTGITYCASHPENAAFVGWDETNDSAPMSGITADNGLTWKHIPNTTPGTGGKIAMSSDDPKKMVWAPHGVAPVYTLDGGNTWSPSTYNGAPLHASWQLTGVWWNGDVLAADQATPGTFYYFDNGDFYSSSDYGATWKKSNIAWPEDPHWVINVSIVPNPAKAGDVWMALAPDSNQAWTYQLLHSTDGGKSFVPLTTLAFARYVAFGRGTDTNTPAIYVEGRANADTQDAIYESIDSGATWTRISDPVTMQFGEINSLEGDMRTRDLVYVGLGGRGILFGYGKSSGILQARARTSRPALH
ncbi:MAG TPA: hypothetical protein VGJ21_22185 [Terracidiphilus sp.]|jgi:photosystem II stability/assembly factor-like uncharacterized protein